MAIYGRGPTVYIPKGLKCGDLIQFVVDNIDVIEDTLDGQGTFHGTQIAAFQKSQLPVGEQYIYTT